MRTLILPLLLCSTLAQAELMPKDVTPSDVWVEAHWCGVLRETQLHDDSVWFIYEGLPVGRQRPSLDNCAQAFHNPNRFSAGTFALVRSRKEVPDWMVKLLPNPHLNSTCQMLGMHHGQIQGFVDYQGVRIPYLRGMQYPQRCVSPQSD